jgi:hypothetical protein
MVLGGDAAPLHSDEELEVYSVAAPAQTVPFLSVGEGWEPREQAPDGTPYRWMRLDARLRIDAPEEGTAFLSFRAASLGFDRTLVIYHGDHKVFEEKVGTGVQPYRTSGPLGIPAGVSTLRLVSPQGTSAPLELGLSDDPRQLSFVLMELKLEPSQ